ncbi:MAG: hypothetical protein N2657_03435 [bacterium]|nr:hypothetical protein [bacterium]
MEYRATETTIKLLTNPTGISTEQAIQYMRSNKGEEEREELREVNFIRIPEGIPHSVYYITYTKDSIESFQDENSKNIDRVFISPLTAQEDKYSQKIDKEFEATKLPMAHFIRKNKYTSFSEKTKS